MHSASDSCICGHPRSEHVRPGTFANGARCGHVKGHVGCPCPGFVEALQIEPSTACTRGDPLWPHWHESRVTPSPPRPWLGEPSMDVDDTPVCEHCKSEIPGGGVVVFAENVFAHRGDCADRLASDVLMCKSEWCYSDTDIARALGYLRGRCNEQLLDEMERHPNSVAEAAVALREIAESLPLGPLPPDEVEWLREALTSIAHGLVTGMAPPFHGPPRPPPSRVPPREGSGVVDGGES